MEDVIEHPELSVTVTKYVPAQRPVAVPEEVDCTPDVASHAYEYGADPPVGITVPEPSHAALHSALILDDVIDKAQAGSLTEQHDEETHPLLSVIVTQ
jgi:hypothetical protein